MIKKENIAGETPKDIANGVKETKTKKQSLVQRGR